MVTNKTPCYFPLMLLKGVCRDIDKYNGLVHDMGVGWPKINNNNISGDAPAGPINLVSHSLTILYNSIGISVLLPEEITLQFLCKIRAWRIYL